MRGTCPKSLPCHHVLTYFVLSPQQVLGRGKIAQKAIIKARFFSKTAEEKIKKAGGACVLTA